MAPDSAIVVSPSVMTGDLPSGWISCELRRRQPGLGVALIALHLIGRAQLLQQPQNSLRAGVVEVMKREHGVSSGCCWMGAVGSRLSLRAKRSNPEACRMGGAQRYPSVAARLRACGDGYRCARDPCLRGYTTSRSRGALRPRFASSFALLENQRAQGRPGACCTRGLACDLRKQNVHTSIQGSGSIPAFPAQWLYGLLRALPGERLFCLRRLRDLLLARLSASTAAPEPHDFAVRFQRVRLVAASASTASHRAFVTMANAPQSGETGGVMRLIWVRTKAEYF